MYPKYLVDLRVIKKGKLKRKEKENKKIAQPASREHNTPTDFQSKM